MSRGCEQPSCPMNGKTHFIVVAPYCPAGRTGYTALGAASKIEAVLIGLSSAGRQPELLNTGHQDAELSAGTRSVLSLGGIFVDEIQPMTLPFRPLGKCFQALLAPLYAVRLLRGRNVGGLWLYNSYLFEVIIGVCARLMQPDLPIVLELEDAPLARKRTGLGWLKTKLDSIALRLIVRRANVVTLVQPRLRELLGPSSARIIDLPVLFSLEQWAKNSDIEPLGAPSVGYFGGLSSEKGADKLIDVIKLSEPRITWHVTGVGELAPAFQVLAKENPERVHFYGTVTASRYKEIYAKVDAIVNLHRSLDEFSGGIFPFKLLEAVAANKLLISTVANGCPGEIAASVVWVKGDIVAETCGALARIEELQHDTRVLRNVAAEWVRSRYGAEEAIARIVGYLE
jgi:glycosyltransferase involved in cell wall biosynthesis